MNLSTSTQAILLLTSHFGGTSSREVKPLSNSEWGRFALWLKEKELTPVDLFSSSIADLLEVWGDKKITQPRVMALMSHGNALALAVEKWQRAGLWIISRADPVYPDRLKAKLRTLSPPVLFGCGDPQLLNLGGLAVIGSRNASSIDLDFTKKAGENAAAEGIGIVSGAARGVDETAMLGSLDVGGFALGIVADSLLRSATSKKWRRALMDKRLALVSPFQPEAGFNVGNAMARNKYIYCLADSSLVVHSGKKGGTINGAEENLKNGWVPLWVKPTDDTDAANSNLVEKGGLWCEGNAVNLKVLPLIETAVVPSVGSQDTQADMFADHIKDQTEVGQNGVAEIATSPENTNISEDRIFPTSLESSKPEFQIVDFYRAFINEISNLSQDDVKTDELVEKFNLHKSQVNAWLKRACDEGELKKVSKPVRYRITDKN